MTTAVRSPAANPRPVASGRRPSSEELRGLATELRVTTSRLLRRVRAAASGGLTPSQLACLTTLDEVGPLRLGELAAREGVSAPTMSRTVDGLVAAGLAFRRPDPADARSAFVELTDEGRRAIRAATDRRTALLATHLAELSVAELRRIHAVLPVLHRLADALSGSRRGHDRIGQETEDDADDHRRAEQ